MRFNVAFPDASRLAIPVQVTLAPPHPFCKHFWTHAHGYMASAEKLPGQPRIFQPRRLRKKCNSNQNSKRNQYHALENPSTPPAMLSRQPSPSAQTPAPAATRSGWQSPSSAARSERTQSHLRWRSAPGAEKSSPPVRSSRPPAESPKNQTPPASRPVRKKPCIKPADHRCCHHRDDGPVYPSHSALRTTSLATDATTLCCSVHSVGRCHLERANPGEY